MTLELHFVNYIRISGGHCQVTFPYKEILSNFEQCDVTFPYRELLSFFGGFVQKKPLVFQNHLFRKRRNNQMAAVMLQVIPSFYTNYSKNSLFISAKTYEKFNLSKEFCIGCHDDKMCLLPNCRYHIVLIGNIKDLLQKLDAFCFNYEQLDCLYTLFKYRFSGKFFVKSGPLFDNSQRAVQFNQQNRGVDSMPSFAKKTLEEKVQITFVELLPKDQVDAN